MPVLANALRSKGDPTIIESGPSSMQTEDRIAKSIGWFSVGLGLVELLAPGRVTRVLGMQGSEGIVRAFGARELASGIATLSTEKEAGLWSRVGGDAMDLAALSNGLSIYNPKRNNVWLAMAAVAGVMALDLLTASSVTSRKQRAATPRLYSDRTGFPKGVQQAKDAVRRQKFAKA
jgi:hypothetical protein